MVVELSKVKFPSQTDSFRVRLAKTDDECRVVFGSCNVKNTLNHAPTTAKSKLPSKVVIATLQVKMKLAMTAFAKLSVEYEFELTPLDVATTDILAAKIRDLQENVKALKDVCHTTELAQLREEVDDVRRNLGYY
ncbi:hypothetical protein H257_12793 [Aphanomyces astaci]|uniref:Uncharacterized protein n=1 Tax=Aphanomyces astaci TaxID=112090 RepID=W4FWS8_APHAT|nr:hypothetical protein H257_12793 [Aphanomyces astaci]ETV71980.1 hypothetical protein H257_12793 [Aphanomyces astaci]|eukprot:XP_009838423.1 hypothetical protein H257_12793 [Aphanomyces astaci]